MSHEVYDCYGFYREKLIKARIPHRCGACGEVVSMGHRYVKASWLWEGSVSSAKRCIRCQAIHEHLRNLAPGDTWPDETLKCGLDYEKEWGERPPPEIEILAFVTQEQAQVLVYTDLVNGG